MARLPEQDYGDLLRTHRENDADITIATHSVGWKQASLRGIIRVDDTGGGPPSLGFLHTLPCLPAFSQSSCAVQDKHRAAAAGMKALRCV